MPSPYSNDLRIRVIKAIELGKQSKPKIAQHFYVSLYFVYSLWSHYQATGSVKPKQIGGYMQPKVNKVGEEHIKEWLANNPDLTLEQLCDRYEEYFTVKMGTSSMDRALKRAKITVKKSPYDPKKESPLIQTLTQEYIKRIRDVPHGKVYFADEMGAGLNLIPSYGRAPSTERVYDTKPTAKGKRSVR